MSVSYGGKEVKKDVWIGIPVITDILGGLYVTPNSGYILYTTKISSPLSEPTSYVFSVIGGGYYLLHDNNDPQWRHTANVIFYDNAGYRVLCKACNTCGCSGQWYILVQSGQRSPSSIVYPNPADNILYVDLDAFAQANPSPLMIVPNYDVRLYDGSGQLVQQQKDRSGIIQFNVANLPDGFYYLHIYDGSGAKPVTRQILVKH